MISESFENRRIVKKMMECKNKRSGDATRKNVLSASA
jgi:hypothetical protein